MDDLISRKALREAMYHEAFEMDSDMQKWDSGCWIRYKMFENHLKDAPSIPAVPLDKLCEYLNSVIYPCIICKESPGPQCNAKRKGCWYRVLTKWMEEQNA